MYITYSEQCNRYTYIKKTTIADEELLESAKFDKKLKKPKAKKIQISVSEELMVLINNKDEMLITPEYGLFLDYTDKALESLKALTSGVEIYAIIGY
nr:MAG TPA: hypothetical protein [Caudoviricetes sp.]